MNMTLINLYRYSVDEAGREAVRERRPVSAYRNARAILFDNARLQVARALFCAKLDGVEFSKRR